MSSNTLCSKYCWYFLLVRVSQMFLMIALLVSQDSLLSRCWFSESGMALQKFILFEVSPRSPYRKGRWSYTVIWLRPFPATRPLHLLLPELYLPLLFTGPAPSHPSGLGFHVLFSKGSSVTTLSTWDCFFLILFQPLHCFHFLCSVDHNLHIFY